MCEKKGGNMKPIHWETIDKKGDYFFNLTDVQLSNLHLLMLKKQPDLTVFASAFQEGLWESVKKSTEFPLTEEERDFGTEMLLFILYVMLPQDKKVKPVTAEVMNRYMDNALDILKKVSDDNPGSISDKAGLLFAVQENVGRMVFSEIYDARDNWTFRGKSARGAVLNLPPIPAEICRVFRTKVYHSCCKNHI